MRGYTDGENHDYIDVSSILSVCWNCWAVTAEVGDPFSILPAAYSTDETGDSSSSGVETDDSDDFILTSSVGGI